MNDDSQLLRRFAQEGSQPAFAELVQRKVGLVYAAALRQTGGDAHLAQDVAQSVFLALAGAAARLQRHAVLVGWLHTTTRHLALQAMRKQQRWRRREQEASTMNTTEADETETAWRQLRPEIDAALQELAAKDRDALLLRFFEGQSLAEVGAAVGIAENTARMRVERALEKLRGRLARRGITSTAAALGIALAQSPAVAVPAGLAASATSAGMAAALAAGGGVAGGAVLAGGVMAFMNTGKLVVGALGAVAFLGIGAFLGARYQSRTEGAAAHSAAEVARAKTQAATAVTQPAARIAEGDANTATASTAQRAAATEPSVGNREAARRAEAIAALRLLVDLKRRNLVSYDVRLIGSNAQLTPEFAELFALAPEERTALQRTIDETRERLAALEREHTTTDRAPNGDVMFAVKAFPEAGGALYDTMLRTFADTLGTERQSAFLALGAEQTEKELGRFGTVRRKVTVSRDLSGDVPIYRIRDETSATPQDHSNYVSDRLTAEQLRKEARGLSELLPADFLRRL